jgi:hypothetical protein
MIRVSFFWRGGLLAALLFLLLAGPGARAQAPTWQMAVAASQTANNSSFVYATAADAAGNVYLAGFFAGNVSFGSTVLTTSGAADNDMFVAKWSPASSSFEWAQRAGGQGNDYATALAVRGTDVYVVGAFASSTASFGSITLTNAASVSPGTRSEDAYVAKLTDAGTSASFVWAQQAGGLRNDQAAGIAVQGSNVYVVGAFESPTADFGSIALTNSSGRNQFMAKLTDGGGSGSFTWVQQDNGNAMAVAVQGASVYVAGTNAGNACVTKLVDAGSAGSIGWTQTSNGAGYDYVSALAVQGTSIYVTGAFSSTTVAFGSVTLTNAGVADVFVAKLVDSGTTARFAWALQAGGTTYDQAKAVTVAGSNVYVAGEFSSHTAGFGSTTLTNAEQVGNSQDIFVARLSDGGSAGTFTGALQAGSTRVDGATALAVTSQGVYVGGYAFLGSAPFLPASFGSLTLASPMNGQVGFLALFTDPTLTATNPGIEKVGMSLFPNPAHTSTTVQLPAQPGAASATLTLTDALGRPIRTEQVALPAAGLRHELSLTGLAPGLYALRVRVGEASAVRRLVVE